MTYLFRVDTHRTPTSRISWPRELVQVRADDVVHAAALFKPNAAGSHELTPGAGFGHRQLLKASGAYLGERIALGATALHVHALALMFGGRASRSVACWPRDEVRAELVAARGAAIDNTWPALRLSDRQRRSLVELQALDCDDDAWELLTLLLRTNPSFAC